jgi:hypothetical protein
MLKYIFEQEFVKNSDIITGKNNVIEPYLLALVNNLVFKKNKRIPIDV